VGLMSARKLVTSAHEAVTSPEERSDSSLIELRGVASNRCPPRRNTPSVPQDRCVVNGRRHLPRPWSASEAPVAPPLPGGGTLLASGQLPLWQTLDVHG